MKQSAQRTNTNTVTNQGSRSLSGDSQDERRRQENKLLINKLFVTSLSNSARSTQSSLSTPSTPKPTSQSTLQLLTSQLSHSLSRQMTSLPAPPSSAHFPIYKTNSKQLQCMQSCSRCMCNVRVVYNSRSLVIDRPTGVHD